MKPEIARKILEETRRNYDKIAEEFSESRSEIWPIMKVLTNYVQEGDKILDIGCGNGRLFDLLKEKNVDYVGIDNSEKLIEIAKQKFSIFNFQFSKPEFIVADALDLPFPDEEFDAVFMMAVLPHIPSAELQLRALKNARRVLKKDGYIFITCWNLWQPKMFWQNLKNRIKNPKLYQDLGWRDFMITWKNSQKEILAQRFYRAFTKKEIKKLLEKSGFKMEKIYYEHKGKKTTWLKGFNLVAVARKT